MTHQSTKEADTQAGHRHVRGNREITKTGKEKRKDALHGLRGSLGAACGEPDALLD